MSAADELATVEAALEHHWFVIHHHQECIRQLQQRQAALRDALAREDARLDRQARRYLGQDVRAA